MSQLKLTVVVCLQGNGETYMSKAVAQNTYSNGAVLDTDDLRQLAQSMAADGFEDVVSYIIEHSLEDGPDE
jgi:hypothetical protein